MATLVGVAVVGPHVQTRRLGEEARPDAVFERVADDGDADERGLPVRPEAPVVPRRVEVPPVEVLASREKWLGRRLQPWRPDVHVLAEPRDRTQTRPWSSRTTAPGARIRPASLAPERVAHDASDPERPGHSRSR